MKILVTGGAGYIGSHTSILLLQQGYQVVIVDNLVNSKVQTVERVEKLAQKPVKFYRCDINDKAGLDKIFKAESIDAVIHFAGLKAVGESVKKPLEYYQNNISGTLTLLEVMRDNNVLNLVFSSSATVYGNPKTVPITEDMPLSATNPYGQTKLMIEQMLNDIYNTDQGWSISILRYFNPVGAHESGMIGEDPNGIPNNLTPYILKVAIGQLPQVNVFGNDYDTPDGTGVRDYIHVCDLAEGHINAVEKIASKKGLYIHNLGTGVGYSVLDMIKAFEKSVGKTLPYTIAPRRPGDIAVCYADPKKARDELGFTAKKNLEQMCADAWNWQRKNPNGYEE